MSNKVVVFPYSKADYSLCIDLCNRYENVRIATFSGTSFVNKDISYCVNKKEVGILIQNIYEIENFNKLIVLKNELSETFINLVKKYVNSLSNVEVISFIDLEIQTSNVKYELYNEFPEFRKLHYFYPDKPVIFVNNVIPTADSEFVVYKLKNSLNKKKIKASFLMNRENCKLSNFWVLPKQFKLCEQSIEQSIYLLNQYIRYIFENDNPELFVIENNNGMLRYDDNLMNTFGIYNYMISEAVKPDYTIVTMSTQNLDLNFIKELNDYSTKKYDSPIDAVHVTNEIRIDSGDFAFDFVDKTTNITTEEVVKKLMNYNYLIKLVYLKMKIMLRR